MPVLLVFRLITAKPPQPLRIKVRNPKILKHYPNLLVTAYFLNLIEKIETMRSP